MFPNPEVLLKHYQFDYLHDRVKAVCDEEQIHCVDLRQPFLSSFTQLKDIVVSSFDGHPSARASLVAADQILAEFRPLWQPPTPTSQSLIASPVTTSNPTRTKPARSTTSPKKSPLTERLPQLDADLHAEPSCVVGVRIDVVRTKLAGRLDLDGDEAHPAAGRCRTARLDSLRHEPVTLCRPQTPARRR